MSGGKLTGSTGSVLQVDSTDQYDTQIELYNNGTYKGSLAFNKYNGVYIYNKEWGAFIGIQHDGTPYYNNGYNHGDSTFYELIHAGNIDNYLRARGLI